MSAALQRTLCHWPCTKVLPHGLVIAGRIGKCYWPERCRDDGRCIWARHHQLESKVRPAPQPDLFSDVPKALER
jgi:hypothetical protein